MLPAGTGGLFYSQTLSASGGTAAYSFAVTGGALPNGLTLDTNDTLSGTPDEAGNFNVTVTATGATGLRVQYAIPMQWAGPFERPAYGFDVDSISHDCVGLGLGLDASFPMARR